MFGYFVTSHPESRYIVSGNPYISTNRATMNAENALNERQSRDVRGFVKLNAKIMKISELIITRDHKPYAGASFISCLLPERVRHAHARGAAGAKSDREATIDR